LKNTLLLFVATLLLSLGAVAQDPIKPLPPPLQFPLSAPQPIPPAPTPVPLQAAPVPLQAAQPGVHTYLKTSGNNAYTFHRDNNTSDDICVTVSLNEDKSFNVVGSTVGTITVEAGKTNVYVGYYKQDVSGQRWFPVVHTEWTNGTCD
jgi:hypothetical protein